jgi:phage/plasmid-associated DNA primase
MKFDAAEKKYIVTDLCNRAEEIGKSMLKYLDPRSHLHDIYLPSACDIDRRYVFYLSCRVMKNKDSPQLCDQKQSMFGDNMPYELSIVAQKGSAANARVDKPRCFLKPSMKANSELLMTVPLEKAEMDLNSINDDIIKKAHNKPKLLYMRDLINIMPSSVFTNFTEWYKIYESLKSLLPACECILRYFLGKSSEEFKSKMSKPMEIFGILETHEAYNIDYIESSVKRAVPERYNELNQNKIRTELENMIITLNGNLTAHECALHVREVFKDRIKYDIISGDKMGKWYEFMLPGENTLAGQAYKWVERPELFTLEMYISEEMRHMITKIKDTYDRKGSVVLNESQQKHIRSISGALDRLRAHLGNPRAKQDILSEAKKLFYTAGFIKSLDQEGRLLGVGNGILILGKETKLITTIHNYRVSKYTEINADPEQANNPMVRAFLDDIFLEEDAQEKVMMYFASSLDGCHKTPKMMILDSPDGSSGKSSLAAIHQEALCLMYADKFPTSGYISTARLDSSKANSAYELLLDKRFLYSSENKKDAALSTDILREILSGERFSNRALYANQRSGYIIARIIHLTNNRPKLSEFIYALSRRFLMYTFKFTFKPADKLNKDAPREKLAKTEFINKCKTDKNFLCGYLSYLAFVLYPRYISKYDGEIDNIYSKTIDEETNKYFEDQDKISQFLNKRIVVSASCRDYTLDEIADAYIKWHMEAVSKNLPKKDDVRNDLKSSRLFQYLIDDTSKGTYILRYHRILADTEQHQLPGEGEFGKSKILYDEIKSRSSELVSANPDDNAPAKIYVASNRLEVVEVKAGLRPDFSDMKASSAINPEPATDFAKLLNNSLFKYQ